MSEPVKDAEDAPKARKRMLKRVQHRPRGDSVAEVNWDDPTSPRAKADPRKAQSARSVRNLSPRARRLPANSSGETTETATAAPTQAPIPSAVTVSPVERMEAPKIKRASQLSDPYLQLIGLFCECPFFVRSLAGMVDAADSQKLADCLINLSSPFGCTLTLIKECIKQEFEQGLNSGQESAILRGNSVASKMMVSYSRVVGGRYIDASVGDEVRRVVKAAHTKTLEIDPIRVPDDAKRNDNLQALTQTTEKILDSIVAQETVEMIPPGICAIASFTNECAAPLSDQKKSQLVGGFLILRLLNPSLISPDAFGILPEAQQPGPHARRNLTLVSKLLQNVSNGVIASPKEPFMAECADFVKSQSPRLQQYLSAVSSKGDAVASRNDKILPLDEVDITTMKPRHVLFLAEVLERRRDQLLEALTKSASGDVSSEQRLLVLVQELAAHRKKWSNTPETFLHAPIRMGKMCMLSSPKSKGAFAQKRKNLRQKYYSIVLTPFFLLFFPPDPINAGAEAKKSIPLCDLTMTLKGAGKKDPEMHLTYYEKTHRVVNDMGCEDVSSLYHSLSAACSSFESVYAEKLDKNARFSAPPSRGPLSDTMDGLCGHAALPFTISPSEEKSRASHVAFSVSVPSFGAPYNVSYSLSEFVQTLKALREGPLSNVVCPALPHLLFPGHHSITPRGEANAKPPRSPRGQPVSPRGVKSPRSGVSLGLDKSGKPSLGLKVFRSWTTTMIRSLLSCAWLSHSAAVLHFLKINQPNLDQFNVPRLYFLHRYGMVPSGHPSLVHYLISNFTFVETHRANLEKLIDMIYPTPIDNAKDARIAHFALTKSQPEIVEMILDAGYDSSCTDASGNLLLHISAADDKFISVTRKLLAGGDPEQLSHVDRQGRTPLHISVELGASSTSLLLLAQIMANPNITIPTLEAVLLSAINNAMADVAMQLIQSGLVDVSSVVDSEERSALALAAHKGLPHVATELIKRAPKLAAQVDIHEQTPLCIAAAAGNAEVLDLLIPVSDLNIVDSAGSTALHLATDDCVKSLLNAGADHSARDAYERTPILTAAEACNIVGVRALLEANADVKAVDAMGRGALHAAVANDVDVDLLNLLGEHGASVVAVDANDTNVLLTMLRGLVIRRSNMSADHLLRAMRVFILFGGAKLIGTADPSDAMTPLHLTCQLTPSVKIVRTMLEYGSKLDDVTSSGDTPLHFAVTSNAPTDVIEFMVTKNANVNAENKSGESPLELAINNKMRDIVLVLAGGQ